MSAWLQRWRGSWASMGRELRDTWFTLLVLAWIQLPQWPDLPWWCAAGSLAILAWRGWLALKARPLPGTWVKAALALAAFAACGVSVSRWWGRDMALLLIVILLSLKTLELRARRDAQVVFYLAFFVLLIGFLRSQSIWMAAHGVISVWALLSLVILSQRPSGRPPLADVGRAATRLWLQGLPLMVLLFALFPRFEPLWGAPETQRGRSGLSDSVSLSDLQSPQIDESVAIEVRGRWGREDSTPDQWYFRAMVLEQFDGESWEAAPSRPATRAEPQDHEGAPTGRAQVTLRYEALDGRQLSRPEWWDTRDERLRTGNDGTWTLSERPRQGSSVVITANAMSPRSRLAEALAPGSERWRRLTMGAPGQHPGLAAWVRQQGLVGMPPEQVVSRLSAYLTSQGFRYTLDPPRYGQSGASPLDDFWLQGKEGFCEHYAASTAVLLRLSGVPARVITGYQGGEPAKRDDEEELWWVRQLQAHAWVEYWHSDGHWIRWDPTAMVGAQRFAALRQKRQAPAVWSVMGDASDSLWEDWRQTWTTLQQQWRRWVVDHDEARQQSWWQQWREWLPGAEPLWTAMGLLFLCTAGLWSLPAAWQFLRQLGRASAQDAWRRRWRRSAKRLASRAMQEAWPHAAVLSLDTTPPTPRQALGALRGVPWKPEDLQALQEALHAVEAARYAQAAGQAADPATVRQAFIRLDRAIRRPRIGH